jgi:TatD DNase family protein
MKLIDTHTHLYLSDFDADRDAMIKRATDCGVVKLLLPNIDVQSVDQMLSAVSNYPGICFPMAGLHPTSVKDDYLVQLNKIEELFFKHKFVAIGEIGIDLYWDKTHLEEQKSAFRRQISFALEHGLPVVVHARESFSEVFSVLSEFGRKGLKGVFHAFTGSIKDAEKAIDIGFKLGIGGIVTFKNSGLDRVVKETGIRHLILETDSPYLSPVPHRGKRNESSYLCLINKKLAEIFGLSEKEVASVTFANSTELFNL